MNNENGNIKTSKKSSADWKQVKTVFFDVLEQSENGRTDFLAEACGDNLQLRKEVEALLAAHFESESFIEQPIFEVASVFEPSEQKPPEKHFGHYKIIREIGIGGMGAVFLAERDDGEFRQQVAIKIVRQTLADSEIVNRFKRERQILAALNHPNIARLLDGGVSDDGLPFLAMEYIEGLPVTEFAAIEDLNIEERLRLFLKICDGVAFAHRNLIVHRDLKPSNIFVAAGGTPKLLDFGLAKLLDNNLINNESQTVTAFRAMTPAYASPEQLKNETITTASDIYSLGIVLYELLTGNRPFHFKNHTLDEAIHVVCQSDPPRPSEAMTSHENAENRKEKVVSETDVPLAREAETRKFTGTAAQRRAEDTEKNPISPNFAAAPPRRVSGAQLKGDVDNIVLKALRKEPERRYSTVEKFAEDIERHLNGLPISARPNTFAYRAEKFIKRNRLSVVAGLSIILILLGGIAATLWQARRAEAQRLRAEKRFDDVRHLSHSLMFEIHDSVKDLQGSTPTRQLIVSRGLQYLDSLAQESGDDASLQRELATAYEKVGDIQGNPYSANLGDTNGALASYRKAIAIREALKGTNETIETQMETGRSYRALGDILEQKGDVADCLDNYRSSLSIFEKLAADYPTDDAVQDELARGFETLGDGLDRTENKAERLENYKKALAIRLNLIGKKKDDAKLRRSIAVSFLKVGGAQNENKAEAIENLRKSIEMFEALSAADPTNARAHREVGFAYYQLGKTFTEFADYPAALESRRKAFLIKREIAEQDPKNTQAQFDLAASYGDLSESLTETNQPANGLDEAQNCLETLEKLSALDPTNAVYTRNIGLCYERLGEAQSQLAAAKEPAIAIAQRIKGWTRARDWYQKASDTFSDLHSRNALMPIDAGQTEKFAAKMNECQNAIERLTRSSE